MKLTDADRQTIADWIGKKCGSMRCTCCGHGQWEVGPFSTLALGFDLHTTRFHYHDGMASVTILCTNCGHMVQFSPAVMGFTPTPPKPPAIEDSGSDTREAEQNGS